jgi:hypothetical protein
MRVLSSLHQHERITDSSSSHIVAIATQFPQTDKRHNVPEAASSSGTATAQTGEAAAKQAGQDNREQDATQKGHLVLRQLSVAKVEAVDETIVVGGESPAAAAKPPPPLRDDRWRGVLLPRPGGLLWRRLWCRE